jgi:ABC-type nickel/cobalt efflux system permease component RcnA
LRRGGLAVLLGLALLLAGATSAATQNPFQSGRPSPPSAAAIAVPSWLGTGIAVLARTQAELNDAIASRIRHLEETGSLRELAVVLALAFAFGVFHAVGPGHGKMVVSSYLMARRERFLGGILLGSLISLVQGVSAIAIVGALAMVLSFGRLQVLDETTLIEVVSYALIVLIGLWMLYQAASGRGHHHHGHGDRHDHAAEADRHHAHAPKRTGAGRRQMIGIGLAAGLVPCASAIIVMLFALAQHAFAIGVEAALAMSLGMAVTVSAIGLASVFARRLLERAVAGSGSGSGAVVLERGLQFGGALTLIVFASLFCLGAWARL